MTNLQGRHALVTGGSRGIGRACAAALTAAGARVTVTGRDLAALEEVAAAGEAAGFEVCDVTDAAAVEAALAAAVARLGPVDVLVASAGATIGKLFVRTDDEAFRQMFDLNVLGVARPMRLVLPGMVERGFGRVVAVSSVSGLRGFAYGSAYCAAKHALLGVVRCAALEVAGRGVTVNAVCPHYTDTDMMRNVLRAVGAKTGISDEALRAEYLSHLPIGRAIRPEEVAEAVVYLCSPKSGAVTGLAMPIDGGAS